MKNIFIIICSLIIITGCGTTSKYDISINRLNYFIGRFEERAKCYPERKGVYKKFIDSMKNNIKTLEMKRNDY